MNFSHNTIHEHFLRVQFVTFSYLFLGENMIKRVVVSQELVAAELFDGIK